MPNDTLNDTASRDNARQRASSQRASFLGALIGAAIWPLSVALVLAKTNSLPGYDAYYHVRLAAIMSEKGLTLT